MDKGKGYATGPALIANSVDYSAGIIRLTVLPLPFVETPEREEVFTISLTSTTSGVVIDPALSSVTITVGQNGSPLGVVSFLGEALNTQRVMEGAIPFTLSLPLERSGDNSAAVAVSFTVSRVAGGKGQPVTADVTPASGTATFPILQGRTSIDLTILSDQLGESDETFRVMLTGVTSGATLNLQASTVEFVIK